MTLFDNILFSSIFLTFPIFAWMIYKIYSKNIERRVTNLAFDISLLTMFYLVGKQIDNYYILYFCLNVPLLLAFFKKRKLVFIFTSFIQMFYFYIIFESPFYIYIIEFMLLIFLYFIFSKVKTNYSIHVIILFKLIFGFIYLFNKLNFSVFVLLIGIFFYSMLLFSIYFLKKAEDLLHYTTALRELEIEKELRTSLFKVTHEIKNPIAVCKGYLDMFDINNLEHSKKYIPIIKIEISKVLNLLQDFLSIRKIKIEKDILDIYYLLEGAVDSMKPLLIEKNIKLNINIPDEELLINADYNRLNQVLINMIKNSIEAMRESSKKELTIDTFVKDNNVFIEIKDTGLGMNKEVLDKVKEPFFTTKESGTGLGVYLSAEIIKEHKGRLEYTSAINKGTKVSVILPINYKQNSLA